MNFNFSPKKNNQLIEEQGISFEEIIQDILEGNVIEIADHPNQVKYPGQQIYILSIDNYIYSVPFIRESEVAVFLKTIFPTRKLTKKYLQEKHHD